MAKTHDDKDRDQSEEVVIAPVILHSVKIKTKVKEVISPVLIPVEIEKPSFIDKEYERPVLVDKEYEKPVLVEKTYERPVVTDKKYERPIVTDVECERPILIDKEYEKPVVVEKEYPIPVPKEAPYDLPVVAIEEIKGLATELTGMLAKAKAMIGDLNEAKDLLVKTITEVKESIPKEIVMPNIIYKDHVVKNVEIVKEKVTVVGKIIARERMV